MASQREGGREEWNRAQAVRGVLASYEEEGDTARHGEKKHQWNLNDFFWGGGIVRFVRILILSKNLSYPKLYYFVAWEKCQFWL